MKNETKQTLYEHIEVIENERELLFLKTHGVIDNMKSLIIDIDNGVLTLVDCKKEFQAMIDYLER